MCAYEDNSAMLSQSKIQQSVLRALPSYSTEAVVQKNSARKLVEYLIESDLQMSLQRVFEFGCGTGFLTNQLVNQFNIQELIVNDLVEECQTYLPKALSSENEVAFIAGDIDTLHIPEQCDLICSASCVQWSQNLPILLSKLSQSLNKGGCLALSSFSEGHFREINDTLNPNSNNELGYWSIDTWQLQLQDDYELVTIKQEQVTMWFDSVLELLLHLRLTGVNGNAGQSWNQQALSDFETDYIGKFEKKGKVPLSYQPIYIVAYKK